MVKHLPFPKDNERWIIFVRSHIGNVDTVNLFFVKYPEKEREYFELVKKFSHESLDKMKDMREVKNILKKESFLSPYLYAIYWNWGITVNWGKIYEGIDDLDIPIEKRNKLIKERALKEEERVREEKIKLFEEMKQRFLEHPLTVRIEALTINRLLEVPKYRRRGVEMLVELAKKYPSLIRIKKRLAALKKERHR